MQFYLNLNNRTHTGLTEFDKINQLPVNVCFEQCSEVMAFNFFGNTSLSYMNDEYKLVGQHNTNTRTFLLKINQFLQNNQ